MFDENSRLIFENYKVFVAILNVYSMSIPTGKGGSSKFRVPLRQTSEPSL